MHNAHARVAAPWRAAINYLVNDRNTNRKSSRQFHTYVRRCGVCGLPRRINRLKVGIIATTIHLLRLFSVGFSKAFVMTYTFVKIALMVGYVDFAVTAHILTAPTMTPEQERVLNESIPIAKAASLAAEGRVLEIFGHEYTASYLRSLAPNSRLNNMSASELVSSFWHEISVAELVHSFGDANAVSANCGFDLSVAMGVNTSIFYNQWELQALGLVPVDAVNNVFTEWSETNLFHFSPFRNVSQPDEETAKSRPFYVAVNMYRVSGGNPQCGPITAVLSRQYVGDKILAAPVCFLWILPCVISLFSFI